MQSFLKQLFKKNGKRSLLAGIFLALGVTFVKKNNDSDNMKEQTPKLTSTKQWVAPELKSSLKDLDVFVAQKEKAHRPVYRLAKFIQSCLRKKDNLNHQFLKDSLCESQYPKPTDGLLTRPAIKTLWSDYQKLMNVTQCP